MSLSPASPFPAGTDLAGRERGTVPWRLWLTRWRARRALWALDPEQMRDAGLTGHDVGREAGKPFWRA